jgi:hypothetical protein
MLHAQFAEEIVISGCRAVHPYMKRKKSAEIAGGNAILILIN